MLQINILMLGGKRCGKTTVLASMCKEIDRALAGTPLRLIPKNSTLQNVNKAAETIRNKIEEFNNPLLRTTVDENPTAARQVYEFGLSMPSIGEIAVNIHDIPGEWLTQPVHEKELKALIAQSHVILIAIDTPYLFYKMTIDGYGMYHEEYNKPKEIANFFMNCLSPNEISNRMILFVPLKCERYYHLTYSKKNNPSRRNYMREIFDAIGKGYRDLLFYLRSTPQLASSLTIAVTPILSAGGIDFVKFSEDPETGKITSMYQAPEFLPESQRGYRPMFCEQPILYALTYMMRLGIDGMWSPKAFLAYQRNAAMLDLSRAYETLRCRLKREDPTDGFFIIQNPKII